MPHLSSPLVVYPKAKQKRYAAILLIPFVALSIWHMFSASGAEMISTVLLTLSQMTFVIWLVCAFIKGSTRDITVVIPPTIAISALKVADKFFTVEEIGLLTVLEVAFWIVFALFFVKGILGKCKIIIPMLFLFFGFFYTFIAYHLRTELLFIGMQIVLFLILWFVLDAATFTSLSDEENR